VAGLARHLSFLPTEIEFFDNRWPNLKSFIEGIIYEVRSLEPQKVVLGRTTSNEFEEYYLR
jgi:hypothetical protein